MHMNVLENLDCTLVKVRSTAVDIAATRSGLCIECSVYRLIIPLSVIAIGRYYVLQYNLIYSTEGACTRLNTSLREYASV